jgi:hypothetical protein
MDALSTDCGYIDVYFLKVFGLTSDGTFCILAELFAIFLHMNFCVMLGNRPVSYPVLLCSLHILIIPSDSTQNK